MKTKRILSFIVTVIMIFVMLPTVSMAEEETPAKYFRFDEGLGAIIGLERDYPEGDYPKEIVIPRNIGDTEVRSIGDFAFEGCSKLERVTIPDSVESIGTLAFDGCTNLKSVTIPDSVRSIGVGAFDGCSKLESVTIPDGVTSIGAGVFSGCASLTQIDVSNSNTAYSSIDGVLYDKSGSTIVAMPGGIKGTYSIAKSTNSIGDGAFMGCTELRDIVIPNSVTSIGKKAFLGCTGLLQINIPNTVTSIGEDAFCECKGLTSISIPSGVEAIAGYVVNRCTELVDITIPNSVRSIGMAAFYGCSKLSNVYFVGTPAEWAGISIGDYNDTLNGKVVYVPITYQIPANSIYNGETKSATVTKNDAALGDITVKYYDAGGQLLNSAPKNAGTYTVKVDIAGNDNYREVVDYKIGTFTIEKAKMTPTITLTAPEKNKIPQREITAEEYTATVAWSPEIAEGEKFAKSTEYTATITIIPTANYTPEGVETSDFSVEGATSVTIENIENGIATVKALFPKTAGSTGGGGGGGVPSYNVVFDTDGGNRVASQTVTKNSKAEEPAEPVKDGFKFGGWYSDKEFTAEFNFNTCITKNITLYAKWLKTEYEPEATEEPTEEPTVKEWKNPFSDVSEYDWFYNSVKFANENSLMDGTEETTFKPNENVTRGMLVTILYRAEGEPAVNKSIPFADVAADSYYRDAVIWAQQNGIVNGVTENEFLPNENITREQMAAVIYRYAQFKGYDVTVGEDTNILSYADFGEISEYAIESLQYAVGSGLIQGKTDSTLNPKDCATRAELAAILQRFFDR